MGIRQMRAQPPPQIRSLKGTQNQQDKSPPTVNFYTVTDQDRHASISRWTLTGEDAGDLQLIGDTGRTLVFRDAPDFEDPSDADGDNVYKVTVVAIDNAGGRAEFDVCIIVTNVTSSWERKITLLDANGDEVTQPRAHHKITAELSDDGWRQSAT